MGWRWNWRNDSHEPPHKGVARSNEPAHTSSIARLESPAGCQFRFTTVPGHRYTAQCLHSLSTANSNGEAVIVSDPGLNTIRHYRVKRRAAP